MGNQPARPRATDPLEDERAANYKRLIEAELQIGRALKPHGVGDQAMIDAMELAEADLTPFEDEHHLYLTVLTRFVDALGGRLELHAVFEDETVVID